MWFYIVLAIVILAGISSIGSSFGSSEMKCPKCGSHNIETMGNDRKGFSVGKAVGGTILAGGVGSLAGFAGKKGKYEVFCKDCGCRWKTK